MNFGHVDLSSLRKRAPLKWGRWPEGIISLSVADIDFSPPMEVRQAIEEWLDEERTSYGDYQGDPDLRALLAQKVKERNKIDVEPDDIVVVPGTMFAIFLACYLFLRPGDEAILSPSPVYGPFWANVRAAGATPVPHDLDMEDGFGFRLETLPGLITKTTRLIMVCNPNNPTGKVLSRSELEGIAELALKHDLIVFSDELYEDMIFEGEHISIASLSPEVVQRTITVYGISKSFGLSGYRVAYMVVPPQLRNRIVEATRRIMVHTDRLAQASLLGALRAYKTWVPALMAHLKEMRDRTVARLKSVEGLRCEFPQATPFVFPDMRSLGMTSQDLVRTFMEKAGVIVEPGSRFGESAEGFVRINVATSWGVLKEALDRLEHTIEELRLKRGGSEEVTGDV